MMIENIMDKKTENLTREEKPQPPTETTQMMTSADAGPAKTPKIEVSHLNFYYGKYHEL